MEESIKVPSERGPKHAKTTIGLEFIRRHEVSMIHESIQSIFITRLRSFVSKALSFPMKHSNFATLNFDTRIQKCYDARTDPFHAELDTILLQAREKTTSQEDVKSMMSLMKARAEKNKDALKITFAFIGHGPSGAQFPRKRGSSTIFDLAHDVFGDEFNVNYVGCGQCVMPDVSNRYSENGYFVYRNIEISESSPGSDLKNINFSLIGFERRLFGDDGCACHKYDKSYLFK